MKTLLITGLAFSILSAPLASASKHADSSLSFEVPDRWSCEKEKAEWVCHFTANPKAGFMVIAAKTSGPEDALDKYLNYLSHPKNLNSARGLVQFAKIETIGAKQYVGALHWQSELPGFFTQYFAGKSENVAVLATVSAKKEFLEAATSDLREVVRSLNLSER